jgi:hypothetical protein
MSSEQIFIDNKGLDESSNKITQTFTNNTSDYEISFNVKVFTNPVVVKGDEIKIYGESIQLKKYYPFDYKGKKHLLYRPSKNVTEIYKVK